MTDTTELDTEESGADLGVKRIENNTHRHIIMLPCTYVGPDGEQVDFPNGIRLLPGLNTVPNRYLIALEQKEVVNVPAKGAKKGSAAKTRFPGRELMKQLLEPVTITTINGTHEGPQITIYEPDAAPVSGRQDGPRLPSTLAEYTLRGALELIKHVTEVKALKAWTKDKREQVATAATSRLLEIGK